MKSYFKIVRSMISNNKKMMVGTFFIVSILLLFELFIPIGINNLISSLENSKDVNLFIYGCISFIFAYLVLSVVSSLNTKLSIRIGNNLLWNMRENIYEVLWKANYFTSIQKNKDKFKFVLSRQCYTAFAIAVIYTIGGFTNFITICGLLCLTFVYSTSAGITIIVCIIVSLLVSFITGKTVLKGFEECNEESEKDTAQIYQTVDLVEATRTNGLQEYYLQKNRKVHNEYMKISEKAESLSTFCESIEESLNSLSYIIIAGLLFLGNTVDDSNIIAILFIANLVLNFSQRLQRQIQVIIKNIPVFDDVCELMDISLEMGDEVEKINKIRFDHVCFEVENRIIFENIDFELHAGENIIIQGENGSGKSSILKMILGLYPATKGQIFLNNKEISTYNPSSFYKQICYISQEELLLNEKVEDYVRYVTHSKVSDEAINQERKRIRLNSEIDAIIENGSTLSGGEKKKIFMLKYLFYMHPSVVILDEIDAGLDKESREVWKTVEESIKMDPGIILIKISHIDSSNEGFDHIIQL